MRGVRRRCALLLPVVLLLTGASAGPEGPVVDTDRGPVRGRTHGAYSTFEGIPFAAPPTGPRRWRLPEPADRWNGVRDAGTPGARCVQLPVLAPGGPVGSEDCLYLNVTAPAGPAVRARPRPVMVWFHGGGFFSGSGDAYRPDRLAVQGDVVVVTVNYRLGVFGLFGHPELGGAPGFALADQRAALRWVGANATQFGGDPGNVTVFGESAGALSVCAHLASPASAGLFHRAIVQSGSCSTAAPPSALLADAGTYEPFVPARRTTEEGARAAARLGCDRPSGVLDCLRALDAGTLATADLMQRFSLVPYGDGTLPTEPRRALEAGRFHRVPVALGTTRDEMRLFLAQTLAAYSIGDENAYRARTERSFGAETARAVEAAYPVSAYPTPAIAWATVLTDASFICPTLRDGAALGRHVPTYGYRFDDRDAPDFTGLPPVPGLPLGAAHGFELPYLFTLTPLARPQQRLADRMAGYWTAFARTGVPTAPGAPGWPLLGVPARLLSLAPGADGIRTVDGRAEHHCGLWDERWPGVTTAE
ncbi:carboxylesterase/lipase family protein [Streptomyces sp. NPDC058874]|uniref:carboxylesterase/lipase family protein n=1 Tax=unclassified Streptomyces TaxID=2593676 RepID=UPI0036B405AC